MSKNKKNKKQTKNMNQSNTKKSNTSYDVPTFGNPTNSKIGKIVIWIVIIGTLLGIIGGFIAMILHLLSV